MFLCRTAVWRDPKADCGDRFPSFLQENSALDLYWPNTVVTSVRNACLWKTLSIVIWYWNYKFVLFVLKSVQVLSVILNTTKYFVFPSIVNRHGCQKYRLNRSCPLLKRSSGPISHSPNHIVCSIDVCGVEQTHTFLTVFRRISSVTLEPKE
jgi:hypothetical protein